MSNELVKRNRITYGVKASEGVDESTVEGKMLQRQRLKASQLYRQVDNVTTSTLNKTED